MFINQSIVAIVFKLINFMMLVGIGFFLFKKYVKQDILSLINKEQENRHALLTQQINLEQQQYALNDLSKKELIECQNFKSKIDEWKKTVLIQELTQQEERNKIIATIKKRHTLITTKKENQHLQNEIVNALIISLEHSLSEHFKNPQEGITYLNTITHFMDERVS